MDVSIFMADGLEECEALLVVDLMRRAGIAIQTVAVHQPDWKGREEDRKRIRSCHDIEITCDTTIEDYEPGAEAALIIPGGLPGVDYLKANQKLRTILMDFHEKKVKEDEGWIGAICAGPTLLADLGILDGKAATVYPSRKDDLGDKVNYVNQDVVMAPDIITGKALGLAIPFALVLISTLKGEETANRVAEEIYYSSWSQAQRKTSGQ
ncbi:DJ-1/PfpI family protein [Kallipyga massiliensis]|uniref:DJ-1/PfpI family protein n=1 Tax=Kallipyga massiliensis TaxID=1472764 RepID=UPI0026EE0F7D|nr:DJ-1/PfpI family protein [Kallipyga massiliensis]